MAGPNYISPKAKVAKSAVLHAPVRLAGTAVIKHSSEVGRFTFINSGTTIFPGTKVGAYCSIGKTCEVGAFDHPITWLSSSPVQYNMKLMFPDYVGVVEQKKIVRPTETIIGNDVWLGSMALIKRGLTIGDGAIIAGGSVVVNDVPPYAIVGGVPGKIIRYRFDEEIIERLLALKWWDLPIEALAKVDFDDIERAVDQLEAIRAAHGTDESRPGVADTEPAPSSARPVS